jgi:hypothetical protein
VQLDRRDAGRHFREQLHYPTALLGALVEHPIEAAGLTGQIGFYGTGRDAGRAEVAVLHEGRLLTAVTTDLPIGHFRAFVSGETVRPNGELNDLESGLPEITEAMHSAAAQCLRTLFREFDDDDDMAHAALVEEVLRVIVWARGTDALPPFDLREAAETSRLFRSTRGERLDFRQVSALADGGALPIATSMTTTEALFVPEPRRRLIEEVFGEWTFRVVTGSDGEGAGGQHGERVADRRPSWLLNEAARRLRRICSGSDERMQRQYAVDLRWADRPLDGALCRVRGRQVRIDVDHPIVTALAGAGPLAGYVVASLVTTEINRRRRRVSDAYELGLQRKLLEELTDE